MSVDFTKIVEESLIKLSLLFRALGNVNYETVSDAFAMKYSNG